MRSKFKFRVDPAESTRLRGDDCWKAGPILPQLAIRYRMVPERIRQLLSQWPRRAMVLGYLQSIPGADSELARTARPGRASASRFWFNGRAAQKP